MTVKYKITILFQPDKFIQSLSWIGNKFNKLPLISHNLPRFHKWNYVQEHLRAPILSKYKQGNDAIHVLDNILIYSFE
jgi:hypothetical protein